MRFTIEEEESLNIELPVREGTELIFQYNFKENALPHLILIENN